MPRQKIEGNTRQVYATIREDLYLAAKARAAELRVPLRELIEAGLELVISGESKRQAPQPPMTAPSTSVWDDEYLEMQAQQPLGSPVELTREEAEKVVRGGFEETSEDESQNIAPED